METSAAIADHLIPPADTPFKYLDYYTNNEEDQRRFDGRKDAIQVVASAVAQNQTFVLYGRSGIGKTSLLLAGVFPELKERGYQPIYVRTLSRGGGKDAEYETGSDLVAEPEYSLFFALQSFLAPEHSPLQDHHPTRSDLKDLVAEAASGRSLVLVLDQFEEFFIHFADRCAVQLAFVDTLADLIADPKLGLRVLFSLRQDYLAALDQLVEYIPDLAGQEYRLRALTAFGARRAIAAQLDYAGVPYTQRFLVNVVNYLGRYRFDPTFLQVVCSEAYSRARLRNPDELLLRARDLVDLDVLTLFRQHLDQLVDKASGARRLLAHAVLDSLITTEGTKRAATASAVRSEGQFVADEETVVEILDELAEARLVRRQDRGGEVWYELIHERLAKLVSDWLDVDEEYFGFRMARDIIANSCRGGVWRSSPDILLTVGQLVEVVRPFGEYLALTPEELEFVLCSALHRESQVDLVFWADRVDVKVGCPWLMNRFESEDPKCRANAAWAAGLLPEYDLAGRCATLLRDGDRRVRDAAAQALVRLNRLDEPGMPHSLRVKQWARQSTWRNHKTQIRKEGRRGAVRGGFAGFAWNYAVFVPFFLVLSWAIGERWTDVDGISSELAWIMGLAAPLFFIAVGALLGYRFTVSAERQRLTRPAKEWGSIVSRSWGVPILLGALVFSVSVIGAAVEMSIIEAILYGVMFGASGAILAQLYLWLCALFIRPNQRLVAGERNERRVWLWSVLTGWGLPILLALIIVTASIESVDPWNRRSLAITAYGGGLFLSLVCVVATLTLARNPGSWLPSSTAISRGIVLGAIALNMLVFSLFIGFDTLPFRALARSVNVAELRSIPISGRLGPGYPDSDYWRIRHDSDAPMVAHRVTYEPRSIDIAVDGLHAGGSPAYEAEYDVTVIPKGAFWLSVGNLAAHRASTTYSIGLEPVELRPPDEVIVTSAWNLALVNVDLTGGVRSAVFSSLASDFDYIEVLLFRDNALAWEGQKAFEMSGRVLAGGVGPSQSRVDGPEAGSTSLTNLAFLGFRYGPAVARFPSWLDEGQTFEIPVLNGRWSAKLEVGLLDDSLTNVSQRKNLPIVIGLRGRGRSLQPDSARAMESIRIGLNPGGLARYGGKLDPRALDPQFDKSGVRYTFKASGQGRLRIELESSSFDALLYVVSPSGDTYLNDDFGDGLDSRIEVESMPGTWTIFASSVSRQAMGPFLLTISQAESFDYGWPEPPE